MSSTSASTLPPLQRPEWLADSISPIKLYLHTAGAPSGVKVSILIEELMLEYPNDPKLLYDFSAISFANMDQKKPEFLIINPNDRVPALVDDSVPDPVSGMGHNVFDKASILQWLVENNDKDNKFCFEDDLLRSKALSWSFFAHGGVGPMQGQANHLLFGWVNWHAWTGIDITPTPMLAAWVERIKARQGVYNVLGVPERKKPLTKEDEEKKAAELREWIFEK